MSLIRNGYKCGKEGVPHTKNPYRQWAGADSPETAKHYKWLADWRLGRQARLTAKKPKAGIK